MIHGAAAVLAAGSNPLNGIGNAIYQLRIPFEAAQSWLYQIFHAFGPTDAIGAYGVSLVVLTVAIKVLLFPVFQTQLKLTKKSQADQRRLAPELAALRKKHKGDPQKLNAETMALYKEHGIHPLSSAAGCLPALVQMPILLGLYSAFRDGTYFHNLHASARFLWIADLSKPVGTNLNHLLQDPVLLVLPLLAGLTTYVQSKMFTPPADPNADEQTQQMAQVSSSMSLIMPLFITYLSLQTSIVQGLVVYWVVSNIFSITQQYFVNGWGQLPILGARSLPPAGGDGKDAGRAGGGGKPEARDKGGRAGGSGGGKSAPGSGSARPGYVGEPASAAAGRRGRRR
jgi:YidC/Oxa1 family membrane protein insertase